MVWPPPGFNLDIGLVSDDAGPLNVFVHGLCGVHAEHPLSHLPPLNETDRRALMWVRQPIGHLYRDPKAYRQQPTEAAKTRITAISRRSAPRKRPANRSITSWAVCIATHWQLLRALERPELPLHNNRSENDIREMVKKRKISAGTRSEDGRRCRDTFLSLKKTCRKHGLSFWEYLRDRVSGLNVVPRLANFIHQAAAS